MKFKTYIRDIGGKSMTINDHLSIKEATILARESGLIGRLEISHHFNQNKRRFTLALYFINKENTIIGQVFPIKILRDFLFNQPLLT